MSHNLKVGDLVEVIKSRKVPGVEDSAFVPIGTRGVVLAGEHFDDRWGVVYIHVDFSGRELWSRPEALRKIPPPQDWVKLCELDYIPHDIAKPAYFYEWSWELQP